MTAAARWRCSIPATPSRPTRAASTGAHDWRIDPLQRLPCGFRRAPRRTRRQDRGEFLHRRHPLREGRALHARTPVARRAPARRRDPGLLRGHRTARRPAGAGECFVFDGRRTVEPPTSRPAGPPILCGARPGRPPRHGPEGSRSDHASPGTPVRHPADAQRRSSVTLTHAPDRTRRKPGRALGASAVRLHGTSTGQLVHYRDEGPRDGSRRRCCSCTAPRPACTPGRAGPPTCAPASA